MISSELHAFVRASIRSVWALELLLLLRREPGRAWTPAALVQEMRASTAVVDEALTVFETTGLVRKEGEDAFAYAPMVPVLGALADELERAYAARPAAVVRAIMSSPNDKLQNFADAFRFKGDPK